VRWRRGKVWAAGAAVSGLAVVILLVATSGSVRGWIDGRYTRVSGDDRSAVYSSTSPPLQVANEISGKWRLFDRATTATGTFLRYDDLIVGVVAAAGGTRIYVDPELDGYRRWYGSLGPRWGTATGAGERWRGGGPGVGK
jgi:Domain of unknown function (DUF4247)